MFLTVTQYHNQRVTFFYWPPVAVATGLFPTLLQHLSTEICFICIWDDGRTNSKAGNWQD